MPTFSETSRCTNKLLPWRLGIAEIQETAGIPQLLHHSLWMSIGETPTLPCKGCITPEHFEPPCRVAQSFPGVPRRWD
eukprot:5886737-Amphidinium_carterae.1